MLDLLKQLLGISLVDTSKDTILNLYLDMAKKSIVTYKNKAYTVIEFEAVYSNEACLLAQYYYINKSMAGLSSVSQGGRSMSKESFELIPSFLKASLGLPFIGVLGTVI